MNKINRAGLFFMFLVIVGLEIKSPFYNTTDFICFLFLLIFGGVLFLW